MTGRNSQQKSLRGQMSPMKSVTLHLVTASRTSGRLEKNTLFNPFSEKKLSSNRGTPKILVKMCSKADCYIGKPLWTCSKVFLEHF